MEYSRQEVLIRLRRMVMDNPSIIFNSDMSTAELRSIYAANKDGEKKDTVSNICVLGKTLLTNASDPEQNIYQKDTAERLVKELTDSPLSETLTKTLTSLETSMKDLLTKTEQTDGPLKDFITSMMEMVEKNEPTTLSSLFTFSFSPSTVSSPTDTVAAPATTSADSSVTTDVVDTTRVNDEPVD
jgi:hypothetical protein